MWTDLQNRSYEDLARYSGVFIGGGNTFSLLKQVRESGFDRLLVIQITKDLPVFGGNTDAIILGRDIGTTYFGGDAEKNEVGLKVLKGLDVARGYSTPAITMVLSMTISQPSTQKEQEYQP